MALRIALAFFLTAQFGFASPTVAPVESAATIVRAGVESYAYPAARPAQIERELDFLVEAQSRAAARALIEEARHARELVLDLERSQERLAKSERRLLKQAARTKAPRNEAEVARLEPKQRQLELVGAKLAIQGEQQTRLRELCGAVLKALGREARAEALEVYCVALSKERDPEVGAALAHALGAAKRPSALPALIKALSRRELRDAAHDALIQITGRDLGGDPEPWQALVEPKEARQ